MITELHDVHVSRELALLLKQAGFDWKCREYYYNFTTTGWSLSFDDNFVNWNSWSEQYISAPTLEVAQRWLREEKNLVLLIDIIPSYCNGKPMGYKFVIHVSCGKHIYGEWKDTYEEAQQAGIKKALELILEKGE